MQLGTMGRGAFFFGLMCCSAASLAQLPPDSPAYVVARTTLFLCPNIIRSGEQPPAQELEKLGLVVAPPVSPGVMSFMSTSKPGNLLFTYDPATKQCITNYAGTDYKLVAKVMRDITGKTTFHRITGGDKDGAKADVMEGAVPMDPAMIARVIIIENYTSSSSAVSYSERAK